MNPSTTANPPDFTNCPRVLSRAYNGANGKKIAVEFRNAVWMLKFPPSAAGKPNDLSYSNSCFSEHLGSSVFRMLGIPAQETVLGTFSNGSRKIVCACRDFAPHGVKLYDFCSVKNTVVDSETCGHGTELDDVLSAIDSQFFADPAETRRRFWDMFVVDALLGNFDRHNGNWGFLVSESTGAVSLAPVFDCGSCLLPQADDRLMQRMLEIPSELDARILTFPNSMLKIDGRKINYRDFISSSPRPGLLDSIHALLPRINSLDFDLLVSSVPFLSPVQRLFLPKYLSRRRQLIFSQPH